MFKQVMGDKLEFFEEHGLKFILRIITERVDIDTSMKKRSLLFTELVNNDIEIRVLPSGRCYFFYHGESMNPNKSYGFGKKKITVKQVKSILEERYGQDNFTLIHRFNYDVFLPILEVSDEFLAEYLLTRQ